MKKRVLITGISGQVGSQLADLLLEEGSFEVFGFLRWQEDLSNLTHLHNRINRGEGIRLLYGDLNDFSSVMRAVQESKPHYVSHLAAQSFPKTSFDSPLETLNTNILGTANLLESLRLSEHKPEAVHVCSSSEVYGKTTSGIKITEETTFHASSPYSIGKIGTDYLGQFYGEAYGMKTFVTRMGTHSGPRRSDVFFESTVAKQIAMIEKGLLPPVLKVGNLDSVRTYQDARDAVRAYLMLLRKSEEGSLAPGITLNIAGKEVFKLHEIVEILLGLSRNDRIQIVTDPARLRPIDANYQMFDNSKLEKIIDWSPQISVRQMLGDLLSFWREKIGQGYVALDR